MAASSTSVVGGSTASAMDLGGVLMDAGGAGAGASELGLLGAGSGRLLKHARGNATGGEDHGWGGGRAKQARTASTVAGDAVEAAKAAAPFLLGSCGGPGHGGEQMLSFSSAAAASSCASAAAADAGAMPPLYYGTPASFSGLSPASLSASMLGAMARARGPFTPSQWIELEHQALIYKYLSANSTVPHSLLVPIRRSLASSPYPPPYFGTSTLGWGSFQLGYSGSADLEPGRCRRTDGKKWRCSRDAVADQKYCERHMNRGRHRSRKHVEGQPGHAAKPMSAVAVAAAATQPASALAGAGATAAGLTINQHQQPGKCYATGATDPCSLQYNRELVNKLNGSENTQDSDNLSMLTSMNTGNTGSVFPFSKQNTNLFEVTSSRPEFGLVSSDSLMSSPSPHSSLKSVKNLLSSQSLNERQSSASLQHFVDWPRTTPAQGGLSWPADAEDMQARQRSQLSVSAPMASSELSSASTSPIHEKLVLPPLKLSRREYSPAGLVSAAANRDEVSLLAATWATMFRDSSTGGPLGEVLAKNNSNVEARNRPSAAPLSLLTDYYWDSNSGHGMESSPVGVLQRTTAFGSVSSSTGSSPRVENHGACDGTSNLRDDLGSVVVSHPSIRLV